MRRTVLRRPRPAVQPAQPIESGTRANITRRLRWSYLISSTLPLLIVGALLLTISWTTLQRNVYTEQRAVAVRISRDISRYLLDMQAEVARYGLRVRPGIAPSDQILAAKNLEARDQNLIDLAVIDTRGQETLRVRKLLTVRDEELVYRAGDAAVQGALRDGATAYSSIGPGEDGQPTFFLTLPLLNDAGIIMGALRAEISAEPLIKELRDSTVGSASYAYLVDSGSGGVLLDSGEADFTTPRQLDLLLRASQGSAEYAGAHDRDVVGVMEQVLVGDKSQPVGWAVVVERPSSEAFTSVRRSVLLLAILVVMVVVGALFWAFRQARDFLYPLERLRMGALSLGGGHLDHRIEAISDDELGDLARAFNQMAERLQHSLAEIEEQNEHLRKGLALARDIQLGLLPDPPWSGDDIAVYARSIPAYEVGGDFYSYLALPEGRAAIAIGDISGKGVGAALLMALTSSAVESQGRQLEHPAEVLTVLNNLLAPRLRANHMNAALLFAVFDPHTQTLRVANAGMIAPLLVSAHASRFIDVSGLPLGSFVGAVYQEVTVPLSPGDTLLLLSDGVVEAHDARGELFGFDRLEALIAEADTPGDVRGLVEMVLDRVQTYMGEAEQHDDITIVAVRPSFVAPEVPMHEKDVIRYATV